MLNNLPLYIPLVFGATTMATLILFCLAIRATPSAHTKNRIFSFATVSILWLVLQAILALNGFYNNDTSAMPPRIVAFGVAPALLTLLLCFVTKTGRAFIDTLPLSFITHLNIVRIPVELVLYWLYLHKAIPELMTFEGRNFDILAGITAPLMACFTLTWKKMSRKWLLAWNIICLGLLFNIVIHALLSAPSPFQQLAFDQPNIAILYFPFVWLPVFIVPVVLFGHLVSIRQLTIKK